MNEHTIVALLATQGLGDFLRNALTGLTRVGIDPGIVHVARPDNAADEIDPILAAAGVQAHPFAQIEHAVTGIMPDRYVDYGTEAFIKINWFKIRYLRWLLGRYDHVVYADVDVAWLADPLTYLQSVARLFPLVFQSEAVRRFPPVLCWGFLSATSSATTFRLFDALLQARDAQPADGLFVNQQEFCDAWISADPSWLRQIYQLPEGLFLNGLSYRHLIADPHASATMLGALKPFTFHANWTTGLAAKRALMRQTGTWLLDGAA